MKTLLEMISFTFTGKPVLHREDAAVAILTTMMLIAGLVGSAFLILFCKLFQTDLTQ